ncbi:MAG: hypothetical protein RhofKO_37520 [Rhodothermales bacterium]
MRLRLPSVLLAIIVLLTACDSNDPFGDQPTPREVAEEDYTVTDSGLKFVDFAEGEGEPAGAGDTVIVLYNGWLTNGVLFDSSLFTGQPIVFELGRGVVIPGWDEGLAGMRKNGTRQLVIPSELAYGASGTGSIPPNATLIFEVAMADIQHAP